MSEPVDKLAVAETEAAVARERVTATLAALQARLSPRLLAQRAMTDVAEVGTTAAKAGVETARRNPGALAGLTAVAGLFLARHRIAHLFRGRRSSETHDDPAS